MDDEDDADDHDDSLMRDYNLSDLDDFFRIRNLNSKHCRVMSDNDQDDSVAEADDEYTEEITNT